jgi:hypothetical protein
MADTLKDRLNAANPSEFPARMQQVKIGDILAGLVPREIVRTGLTSQATHIEPEPGVILALSDGTDEYLVAPETAGTPAAKASLACGVATVAYDVDGVATIVFEAAKTAYTVVKMVLPATHGTDLATEV